jgi:hypothetical protein
MFAVIRLRGRFLRFNAFSFARYGVASSGIHTVGIEGNSAPLQRDGHNQNPQQVTEKFVHDSRMVSHSNDEQQHNYLKPSH